MDQLLRPESLIFAIPMVAIVAYYWYKLEKAKSDNDLKRRMVDSGLSVDEIERVINAGSGKDDKE